MATDVAPRRDRPQRFWDWFESPELHRWFDILEVTVPYKAPGEEQPRKVAIERH